MGVTSILGKLHESRLSRYEYVRRAQETQDGLLLSLAQQEAENGYHYRIHFKSSR